MCDHVEQIDNVCLFLIIYQIYQSEQLVDYILVACMSIESLVQPSSVAKI